MLAGPALALLFAVGLVRVFIDSATNTSGLDSMPLVLAEFVAQIAGSTWPFFAPHDRSHGSVRRWKQYGQ